MSYDHFQHLTKGDERLVLGIGESPQPLLDDAREAYEAFKKGDAEGTSSPSVTRSDA